MNKFDAIQMSGASASINELESMEHFLKRHLPAHLNDFFDQSKIVHYQPQEVIFREGDPIDSIHFVKTGIVKFLTYLPNGRSRIVRLHAGGALLDVAINKRSIHEHTATATNPVTVYRWRTQQFNVLKEQTPAIYARLLEQCHRNLQRADTWITHFSTGVVRARIARLLLFLAEIERYDDDQIKLLSSEEMASILGVTAESISRVIADLKRQKILQRQAGTPDIFAFDKTRIEDLAEEAG